MMPKDIESWETASGIFPAPDPSRASETPEAVRHHVSGARGHHQKRPEDPEQEKRKIRKASEDHRERCSEYRSQHLASSSFFGGAGPWKQKRSAGSRPGASIPVRRPRSVCNAARVLRAVGGLPWVFPRAPCRPDESRGPNAKAVRNIPGGILPCSRVFSRGLSRPGVCCGSFPMVPFLRRPGVLDLS